MKIVAKFPVELGGHIYRKGEALDYGGVVTQRIADNFRNPDGTMIKVSTSAEELGNGGDDGKPTKEDKIAKTVNVLKREGIIQALEGMGITYSPKAKTDYLAKLLLINKGEIEE